jgi:excisionase family DNA binding protein
MIDGVDIPNLPGYVSIREAADMLHVSDKRVYQYVRAGRLSARRIGNILIVPVDEVRQLKPSPSGDTIPSVV